MCDSWEDHLSKPPPNHPKVCVSGEHWWLSRVGDCLVCFFIANVSDYEASLKKEGGIPDGPVLESLLAGETLDKKVETKEEESMSECQVRPFHHLIVLCVLLLDCVCCWFFVCLWLCVALFWWWHTLAQLQPLPPGSACGRACVCVCTCDYLWLCCSQVSVSPDY